MDMETSDAVLLHRGREVEIEAADAILRGFEDYHERFRVTTRRAKTRFEARDGWGIRRDTEERLRYHQQGLEGALTQLRHLLGEQLGDRELWQRVKHSFGEEILGRDDCELAQTFFNSLTRRLFPHIGSDPAIDFVTTDFPLPWRGWELASARTYAVRMVSEAVLRRILLDADFRIAFDDLEGITQRLAQEAQTQAQAFFKAPVDAVDVLRPVFVRNKGAYIIGRVRSGEAVQPLIFAILNGPDGLTVDAVLQTEDEASILFSFARWYFHADVDNPRSVIAFLASILPRKTVGELYISLGYNKHGKTELYCNLVAEVERTHEQFIVAPGQRGLVMAVFTLPTYEWVYKVIKDSFPQSKPVTRREIMDRYRLVLHHDRVGRLVDYQEFEDLALPRERFEDRLLEELVSVAGKTVQVEEDRVVVRHAYVGRRVYPLDLYLREQPEEKAKAAVVEWGQCLRDLAAANIFAGDTLTKNFGVTRHGRVVFYDYDELRPLTECNFRRIPPARDDFDELADQPWFSIAENDVFPEELERFMGLSGRLRDAFVEHHGELFDASWWQDLQTRLTQGELVDFFPYARADGQRSH